MEAFFVIEYGGIAGVGEGTPGKSAYQVWLDQGNVGDEQAFFESLKGDPGPGGKNPEFHASETHLQYRLVDDAAWLDLVPLANLKGADGANGVNGTDGADGVDGADGENGKSVELQKTATYVQWRLTGSAQWINLVALADIKGAQGEPGANGEPGEDGRSPQFFQQADEPTGGPFYPGDMWLQPD